MEYIIILTIFAVVCVICVVKFLVYKYESGGQICNCYIIRDSGEEDREELTSGRNSPPDMNDIFRSRSRYLRLREPPPDFDTALRNSVPISYIEIEEPPPSYDDFLKSFSSQIEIESSINPCNSLVLDLPSATNATSEA